MTLTNSLLLKNINEEDIKDIESFKKFLKKQRFNFEELAEFLKPKILDEYCYFCGFDINVHKHHLIRKKDGGDDSEENTILLCPNHHLMLHIERYYLQFSNGFYIMRNEENPKFFLFPINKQEKRRFPSIQLEIAIKKEKLFLKEEVNNEEKTKTS